MAMKCRSLNWSTEDWREAFYSRGTTKRPPRRSLPEGFVSSEMENALEAERQRQQREERLACELADHCRWLAEHEQAERRRLREHERIERLRPLAEAYGVDVVERILRIEVPAALKEEKHS